MALLTVIQGDGMQGMVCAAARNASPLTGMATMYLLMGAFHLAPWLKLIANRRGGARSVLIPHSPNHRSMPGADPSHDQQPAIVSKNNQRRES
jgi:hypothetical protein